MSATLVLTTFSVIACALVAGVFLTFSDFVMRSLNRTAGAGGIEAMQVINREVFRTLFMVLLIGMAVVSPILMAIAWWRMDGATQALVLSGGALYLVLVFGVTVAGNVPLNARLEAMSPTSAEAEPFWSNTFYPRWTRLNHVRTLGAAAASVSFLLACLISLHA
tara:strand:+ start:1075 stop:1566 length:492 start_codon:yes stop_codon:yes gene_type:complete